MLSFFCIFGILINNSTTLEKPIILLIFITLLTTNSNAQGNFIFQNEFGLNAGVSNFQGDFAAKGPLDGKILINGFSVNATHFLHLVTREYGVNPLYKRIMLKTSLGINMSSFDNNGKGDSRNDKVLKQLTSKTTIISLDNEFQLFYKDLVKYLHRYNKYRTKSKLNPYVGLGFGINYVNTSVNHNYDTNNLYPDNYTSEYLQDQNTVIISANLSVGARYKASKRYDLVTQMGFKYYLSDNVDGVNPDPKKVNNTANDFNTVISVGVIYHMF